MTQISVYDLHNRTSVYHRCDNSMCMWKTLYHCIINNFLINNLDVDSEPITSLSDLRTVLEHFENDDTSDDEGATTNDETEFERTPVDNLEIVYETDDDEFF